MSEQDNVQRVQDIYGAFGRGDVDAALDALMHTEGTALPTGRAYVNSGAHIISFQSDKVARLQTFEDTAAVAAAFRGRE